MYDNIKVRLKKDVTKEEFLKATFHSMDFSCDGYDYDKMRTKSLNAYISNEDGHLSVDIPQIYELDIRFGYDIPDRYIWEIIRD